MPVAKSTMTPRLESDPPKGETVMLFLEDRREMPGWFDSTSRVYYAIGIKRPSRMCHDDELVIGWKKLP